mgnify:FL=1
MSNPDAVSNWVRSCVDHAFENDFTLKDLHEYIDGAVRAKYELLRDDYVARNPNIAVGEKPEVIRANIISATRRFEVNPAMRKAMWIEALTYSVSEGMQLSAEGMPSAVERESALDLEASDKLARASRGRTVVKDDLPF